MTDADLARIGSTLDLALPAFYRRQMLNYPHWLAGKQPAWSNVVENEFTDNPDRVIYFNQYVRGASPTSSSTTSAGRSTTWSSAPRPSRTGISSTWRAARKQCIFSTMRWAKSWR